LKNSFVFIFLLNLFSLSAQNVYEYKQPPRAGLIYGLHHNGSLGLEIGLNTSVIKGSSIGMKFQQGNRRVIYHNYSFACELYPQQKVKVQPKFSYWINYAAGNYFSGSSAISNYSVGLSSLYLVNSEKGKIIIRPEIGFYLVRNQKRISQNSFGYHAPIRSCIKLSYGLNLPYYSENGASLHQISLMFFRDGYQDRRKRLK
jgi:hypothetical protein